MQDLVEKSLLKMGLKPCPTYSLIDSQSIKTMDKAEERGIDRGKKIKGCKKHIVTDTKGHLLHINVHKANIHDTVGGCGYSRKPWKNIQLLKVFVLTKDTGKLLNFLFKIS